MLCLDLLSGFSVTMYCPLNFEEWLEVYVWYSYLVVPSRKVLAMFKHVNQLLVEGLEYALEPCPRYLLKREYPPILTKTIVIGSKLNRLFFVIIRSPQEGHGVSTNLNREVHKGRGVNIQELCKPDHGGDSWLFVIEILCSQDQDLRERHILDKLVELRVVQTLDNQVQQWSI